MDQFTGGEWLIHGTKQQNERAIGDCVLTKICRCVCEIETLISDSQSNLLHFELLIASLAHILTEL